MKIYTDYLDFLVEYAAWSYALAQSFDPASPPQGWHVRLKDDEHFAGVSWLDVVSADANGAVVTAWWCELVGPTTIEQVPGARVLCCRADGEYTLYLPRAYLGQNGTFAQTGTVHAISELEDADDRLLSYAT